MASPMNLDQFERLARKRRAVRHFKPDPLPEGLLDRLLEIANWAPSGYNLQPTHFAVVTDADIKRRLYSACMNQVQIIEAPVVIVFTGDRRVVENNFERIIAQERDEGVINEQYEQKLRYFVPLAFRQGPVGLNWLWKALLPPALRWVRPIPSMPAVRKEYWLTKQVMLSSMLFMLAAESAGLATVPMEGFDEGRVKKAVGIPADFIAPLITPLGYAVDGELKKTRLPIQEKIHRNGW